MENCWKQGPVDVFVMSHEDSVIQAREAASLSAVLRGSRAALPESQRRAVITNRPASLTTRSMALDLALMGKNAVSPPLPQPSQVQRDL